jgi:hypothetical protein
MLGRTPWTPFGSVEPLGIRPLGMEGPEGTLPTPRARPGGPAQGLQKARSSVPPRPRPWLGALAPDGLETRAQTGPTRPRRLPTDAGRRRDGGDQPRQGVPGLRRRHRVSGFSGAGSSRPPSSRCPEYAAKRLERQRLARELVTTRPLTPERIRAVTPSPTSSTSGCGAPRRGRRLLRPPGAAAATGSSRASAFALEVREPTSASACPAAASRAYYHACLALAATASTPTSSSAGPAGRGARPEVPLSSRLPRPPG